MQLIQDEENGDCVTFSSYFDVAFNQSTKELVASARKALRRVEYDTMVGTGLSGTIVVPVLARALGKRFAIVRKKPEGSHSNNLIEGRLGKRWLFVDDFISFGGTYRRVKEAVAEVTEQETYRDPGVDVPYYSRLALDPAAYDEYMSRKYRHWVTEHAGAYFYASDHSANGYQTEAEVEALIKRRDC